MLERFHRFSYAISEISRCWHRIAADEMALYGLKSTHCVYLLTLHHNPAGITATQLGQQCGKDKADVSRMMTIMEEKGLVQKEGVPYRALLKLTDAGIHAARQVEQRAATAVELGGKGIPEEKRSDFYKMLELIVENLQSVAKDGLPE